MGRVMNSEQRAREEQIFQSIELAMRELATRIDALEGMDDFELVALYEEIEELATRTSFTAVTYGMMNFRDGTFDESYDPTREEVRAQVRRYDTLTKQHPTNAYRRFRAIADRMDEKWTAVDAVLRDRRERAAMGAAAKLANDKSGKHAVMKSIQEEWKRRKDAGLKFTATAFAKEMARHHKDVVTVERIKNAQTKWNKEYHPAS